MEILKEKYKNWDIYYLEDNKKLLDLGKGLADGRKIEVEKVYKESQRNYVAKIKFDDKYYVLKSPRNEYRIPQRRFFTRFKDGEVLTTLKNITNLRKKGLDIFANPLLAMTKRKKGVIIESYIILEYIDGENAGEKKDEAVELVKKMHSFKVYHGDFNPGNFVFDGDKLKVIDTQAKQYRFGEYRAHYDMLTMKMDSYREMEYPYKKDFWFYLALLLKKYKRNTIVEKIKKWKKKKRDQGWKI
ncbi:lipopolysaccharide biosynthesis protein [Fusobacteria bacterium ZRK30]|nr:lipopolysaccharide biosynthesis protein [Fusobacteria bacterium ZRK30]